MPQHETPITKSDYEALASFRAALRRFLRFSEEAARAAGVTPQQHQLLLAVKGQPGRDWASVGDLADALQIHHNAAVGLVSRTEAAGLVARAQSEEDRRQVRVTLTPKGEEMLAHLSQRHLSELQAMGETLTKPFLNGNGQ
ncbi:MAG: MarR family transcriptional regulator [Capsulimonas sp.]|uniref:MarR family winged helix-turn-helix transcriptional regulator n=1 Tax=Capsulimonas sp. TaxID=2494211 RepID=UPI0032670DB1